MSGVSRLQYPTDLRIVRVMCTGRVDLKHIFYAFYKGIDGVMVVGCRLNECKFATEGNYHALNVGLLAKRIMEHIGMDPRRLRVEFMSSADGPLFARTAREMVEAIREIGPLQDGNLKRKLEEVLRLIPYIKIAMREKLIVKLKDPSLWEGHFTREEIAELFNNVPSYWIDPEECRACMACLRRCPANAIDGGKKLVHIINQEKCIKCGTCMEACRFGAVKKLVGQPVPPPIPEEKRTVKKEAA
jgi:coenzyme F420-reducing hydrogenase delta subunit/ferredoxin